MPSRPATTVPRLNFRMPAEESGIGSGLRSLSEALDARGVQGFLDRKRERTEELVDVEMLKDDALTEKKFGQLHPELVGLGNFVPAVISDRRGRADADRIGAEIKAERDANPDMYADIGATDALIQQKKSEYAKQYGSDNERLSAFAIGIEPHHKRALDTAATDQAAKAREQAAAGIADIVASGVEVYKTYDGADIEGGLDAFVGHLRDQLAIGDAVAPAGSLGSQESIVAALTDQMMREENWEYGDEIIEKVRDSELITDPKLDAALTSLALQVEGRHEAKERERNEAQKEQDEADLRDLRVQAQLEARNNRGFSEGTLDKAARTPGGPGVIANLRQVMASGGFSQEGSLTPQELKYIGNRLEISQDAAEVLGLLEANSDRMGFDDHQRFYRRYSEKFNKDGLLSSRPAGEGYGILRSYVQENQLPPEDAAFIMRMYGDKIISLGNADPEAVQAGVEYAMARWADREEGNLKRDAQARKDESIRTPEKVAAEIQATEAKYREAQAAVLEEVTIEMLKAVRNPKTARGGQHTDPNSPEFHQKIQEILQDIEEDRWFFGRRSWISVDPAISQPLRDIAKQRKQLREEQKRLEERARWQLEIEQSLPLQ